VPELIVGGLRGSKWAPQANTDQIPGKRARSAPRVVSTRGLHFRGCCEHAETEAEVEAEEEDFCAGEEAD
jgi:hypothetical protein